MICVRINDEMIFRELLYTLSFYWMAKKPESLAQFVEELSQPLNPIAT